MDPPRAGRGRSISAQGALIIHGVKVIFDGINRGANDRGAERLSLQSLSLQVDEPVREQHPWSAPPARTVS
jgi:hypothetical protein